MAVIERKTKRYPTDLTDEEWQRIAPLLPKPAKRGRKRDVELREVLNAIRYMTRSGGGWRMLPKDFPPWQTVYWWFRRFVRLMLFRTIHDIALMMDRERAGREASPSAGVIDSQTVKAPAPGAQRGYDAAKKTAGRKRHVGGYRRAPADGQSHPGGPLRQRAPGARLRAAHRRLRSDDPCRHGKPAAAKNQPLTQFSN
jgi:putative transposase